jgi:hypothetical protein
VPEGTVAVIDARPDGPGRHLRYGVVDGCPCPFPLVVLSPASPALPEAPDHESGDLHDDRHDRERPSETAPVHSRTVDQNRNLRVM